MATRLEAEFQINNDIFAVLNVRRPAHATVKTTTITMKRLFLLSALFVFAFGLNAQTAKEEIFEDINRSAANYLAYPEATSTQTAPPTGYRPFYLSHYARHGSRFLLNPDDYEKPLAVMREADSHGVLTELGKQTLNVLDSVSNMAKGRYGELTPLGARQHKGIAERMFKNFPEIFNKEIEIDARSTVVIRCILSMTAECERLQALNPKLRFKHDASQSDMYYMNFPGDQYTKDMRASKAVSAEMDALKNEIVRPERLMRTLFNNDEYLKWKVDSVELMISLFNVASNMQSHDTDMELYSLFTKEECYDLWRLSNLRWYLIAGPAPLTEGNMPYIEANLLENILDTADSCVAQEGCNATLRFGHESCLLPLACLMELDDCGYQTTDLGAVDDMWRNYKIFPMASNIQLIFYRKKGSDDILVKALLNEKEARLPVKSKLAPYYHWEDVKAYYRDKLDTFKSWQSRLES